MNFPNIEKSRRPREYVGYADGAWRIRKRSGTQGWRADKGGSAIYAATLADISRRLSDIAAAHRATQIRAILPNPWSL